MESGGAAGAAAPAAEAEAEVSHVAGQTGEAADPAPEAGQAAARRVQVCPDCGEAFATVEEARAHWLRVHRPDPAQPALCAPAGAGDEQGSATGGSSAPEAPQAASKARAQLVEADEEGRPVIVRHVDDQTGAARTVVMNEDGSMRMFGADTVSSMTARGESDLREWMAAMTDRHARGLAHEVRERLVESSQLLHSRRAEVERLSRQINLRFFGLHEGVGQRDLDNAYRRLARSMHPDKNGGTEEAKVSFQAMRGRYEELKTQLKTPAAPAAEAQEPPARPQEDSRDRKEDGGREREEGRDEAPGEATGAEQSDERPHAQRQDEEAREAEDLEHSELRQGAKPEEPPAEEEPRVDRAAEEKEDEKAIEEGEDEQEAKDSEKQQEETTERRRKEAGRADAADRRPEAQGGSSGSRAGAHSGQGVQDTTVVESRDEVEESTWKMLKQLKMIHQNLKIVEGEFRRVETEAGRHSTD